MVITTRVQPTEKDPGIGCATFMTFVVCQYANPSFCKSAVFNIETLDVTVSLETTINKTQPGGFWQGSGNILSAAYH